MQYPVTLALPSFFPYVWAKVFLIFNTKDIDRDSGCVCAQTNLIELSVFSISSFYGLKSIAYIRIRNGSIFTVFTIQKPYFTCWHYFQNDAMQRLHITTFCFM